MGKQVLPLLIPPPVHYVVWESLPGGMESYVSQYSNRFYDRREIFLFSLRPTGNGLTNCSEEYYQQGSHNNWTCYTRFFKYARQHRHDLFHLLNSGPIILLLLLLAGARNPVYHIHGTKYWKTWKDRFYLMTAWRIASWFRVRFVANSGYSAGIFERDVLPHPAQSGVQRLRVVAVSRETLATRAPAPHGLHWAARQGQKRTPGHPPF